MGLRTIEGQTAGLSVAVDWQPSPNFTRQRRGPLSMLCIHVAECAEVNTAAEALAGWVAGPNRPKASWHFAVDANSITQSVECSNESWHAGPLNPYSIGVELAGRSAQTVAQWGDSYSVAELALAARLFAVLCERYLVPVRRVTIDELRAGKKTGNWPQGIVGHIDVTRAISGTHTDPGPNFPWDGFLKQVSALAPRAPLC
jgi:N-acetyl-anhydromuramyl-L-alanine amidase AmpD